MIEAVAEVIYLFKNKKTGEYKARRCPFAISKEYNNVVFSNNEEHAMQNFKNVLKLINMEVIKFEEEFELCSSKETFEWMQEHIHYE